MSAQILPFDTRFIAVDEKQDINMTIEQIRERCRQMGWPGMRIDWPEFDRTGILVIYRMTKKDAYQ